MHIFYGFKSPFKEIVVDNKLITASIEACALLYKFWSHKYGFSQIISCTCDGFHIIVQVDVLSFCI